MGDLMGPAVRVDSQTSLRQVAHDMLECQVEGVVVVDTAGALCGLITEQAVVLTEHSPYRKRCHVGSVGAYRWLKVPLGLICRRDLLRLVASTMSESLDSIPDGCDSAHASHGR